MDDRMYARLVTGFVIGISVLVLLVVVSAVL